MSGHTPGPWEVEEDGLRDGVWRVVSQAYSDETPGICGAHSKHWPLTKEDADLIAAAPDLLKALKFWRDYGGDNLENEFAPICRAAIAKAEGK